ncbi:MAG: hypothetical protein ACRDFS_11945, partial [Chloroflexota bacterium]
SILHNELVEVEVISHRPCRLDQTVLRRLELGDEITDHPETAPEVTMRCPDCCSLMMYRGVGRLRNGKLVHVFECVHSHREVISLSVVVTER